MLPLSPNWLADPRNNIPPKSAKRLSVASSLTTQLRLADPRNNNPSKTAKRLSVASSLTTQLWLADPWGESCFLVALYSVCLSISEATLYSVCLSISEATLYSVCLSISEATLYSVCLSISEALFSPAPCVTGTDGCFHSRLISAGFCRQADETCRVSQPPAAVSIVPKETVVFESLPSESR